MVDWKEMYLSLMRDTDRAIRVLEKSQEKCEEMLLRSTDLLDASPQEAPAAKERQCDKETNV
jgi:hypothetical protein